MILKQSRLAMCVEYIIDLVDTDAAACKQKHTEAAPRRLAPDRLRAGPLLCLASRLRVEQPPQGAILPCPVSAGTTGRDRASERRHSVTAAKRSLRIGDELLLLRQVICVVGARRVEAVEVLVLLLRLGELLRRTRSTPRTQA